MKSIRGFTLIELLIVIGVLGILAVGVFAALNIVSTLGKASLATVKTFSASVENDLSIAQVGKWSFNDSANPGKDTSGYGNDGTLNGGATFQNAATCGLGLGGCLSFDGANDYVEIPNNANLAMGNGSFTISVWINSNMVCGPGWGDGICTIISTRVLNSGDNRGGYYLGIALSHIFFQIGDGTRNNGDFPIPITAQNRWNHIVAVRDRTKTPSKFLLYLNGALKGEDDDNVGDVANSGPLRIGSRSPELGLLFNGFIDEVSIYDQSLTSYQIHQLYAQGLPRHLLVQK